MGLNTKQLDIFLLKEITDFIEKCFKACVSVVNSFYVGEHLTILHLPSIECTSAKFSVDSYGSIVQMEEKLILIRKNSHVFFITFTENYWLICAVMEYDKMNATIESSCLYLALLRVVLQESHRLLHIPCPVNCYSLN